MQSTAWYPATLTSNLTWWGRWSRGNTMDLTFMGPCIVNVFLSTANKMQRYTIFFIVVSAVRVSSGFSAHHQELKNCTRSIGYLSNLFAATANVGESDSPTKDTHSQGSEFDPWADYVRFISSHNTGTFTSHTTTLWLLIIIIITPPLKL